MENFTNSVLIPEGLPEIKSETFHLLDRKYLSIIFIRILFCTTHLFRARGNLFVEILKC